MELSASKNRKNGNPNQWFLEFEVRF